MNRKDKQLACLLALSFNNISTDICVLINYPYILQQTFHSCTVVVHITCFCADKYF